MSKIVRNIPFYLFVIGYWIVMLTFVTLSTLYVTRGLLDYVGIDRTEDANPIIHYVVSWNQLTESAIFAVFLGILFILVNELSERLHWDKLSFGRSLLYKTLIYVFGSSLIFYLVYIILTSTGLVNASIYDETGKAFYHFKGLFFVTTLYVIFNIILLNYIVQNAQKTGKQNLISFLTGKYHHPVIEDRVFMFLDLQSSTTYAERLGNIRYSKMLRDCFHDINHVVQDFEAQIYQYVGDEIVLTWKWDRQKNKSNCIDLYFAFQNALLKRKDYYEKKYGTLPVFKAGLHGGKVTVAEIGNVKRDIAFHGDVLNTASRIQELCNSLQETFLISDELFKRLNNKGLYTYKDLGSHLLKGKINRVGIYAISFA